MTNSHTNQIQITDKQRILEISAVIITGLGKFVFMDLLNWRLPFTFTAITFWIVYIIIQSRRKKGIFRHWGFATHNFKKVTLKVLPFGLISLAACIITGYFLGTINLTWHILPLLLLYPVWGIIQQFLVVGLEAGNLQDLQSKKLSKVLIVAITAVLFALLHYPFWWLVLGTFILAIFYSIIYLKERNVYVLGLFHGWMGAVFFYTVVDRDPFLEMFGRFL